MITIDKERCRGDALCVRVCPASCLRMRNGKAAPVPLAGRACLGCGQCMAVCPEQAVSLAVYGEKKAVPAPSLPDFAVSSALIRSRRSVRHYKRKPVPRDVMLKALETARYAPTGKNRQDVKWIVLDDSARIRELSGMVIDVMRTMPGLERLVASFDKGEDPILREAPCVVFAHASTDYELSQADCAVAVGYLDLVLHSMGIGSCWAGFAMGIASGSPEIRAFFGIEEGRNVYAGLMCGYPAVSYHAIPPRKDPDITWI